MSLPGYPSGGAQEFFGGSGRSMVGNTINNLITTSSDNNLHPSHPQYRTQQQSLPTIFLDHSSQIARESRSLIAKRSLADFQTHQQNHNHQFLSNLLLRSVKPRTFHHACPMSTLTPMMDFSESTNSSALTSQQFGMPLAQHLRPQPINLSTGSLPMSNNSVLPKASFSYPNSSSVQVQKKVLTQDVSKKKVMDHRLQELEKQLLEDNDEEEGDAVSVVTNTEWSETIQNLLSPGHKPISSSPTSSTTSSTSSSSSVASPASTCSKQSLMEAASSISEGKSESASEILNRLSKVSNPNGNSDQRVTEYILSALKSRMNRYDIPPPITELFSEEHAESTQLLFECSPCFKVGFMAANLAILEAVLEEKPVSGNRIHVVGFDIGQGIQYVNLLKMLSARQNGKPATVKITAVAENGVEERLKTVADMLSRTAQRFGMGFEFKVVAKNLHELTRESLGCQPDEPLAVNFAFELYRMPDESVTTENPRDELLRRVKGLSPRVLTLVEQEMNTNTSSFVTRVAESISYYAPLFESLESTMGRDSSERVEVEDGLSRKIRNSLACEGRDRVERCEVFGKWRARMSMAGFKLKPMSQNIAESIKSRLNLAGRVNSGFAVEEENGGICCGWGGRTLTVASAWR